MRKNNWRIGVTTAIVTLGFILAAGTLQAADTVYKWVDENGTTHYGTRPPTGVRSTAIQPKTGHSEPVDYSHLESQEREAAAGVSQGAEETAEQEVSKKNPERCKAAQKNSEILGRGGRVRETTDDGSFRFIGEDEKQERLKAAQKAIAEAC